MSASDFDAKSDKIAPYGISSLVAGGLLVAAKVGLFKRLWIAILALKKFIIIGAIALGGFLTRFFKKKKPSVDPNAVVKKTDNNG